MNELHQILKELLAELANRRLIYLVNSKKYFIFDGPKYTSEERTMTIHNWYETGTYLPDMDRLEVTDLCYKIGIQYDMPDEYYFHIGYNCGVNLRMLKTLVKYLKIQPKK